MGALFYFMSKARTPVLVLSGSVLIGAAVIFGALLLAHYQPWLGLRFSADEAGGVRVAAVDAAGPAAGVKPGAAVVAFEGAGGVSVAPVAGDLLEEPDVVESYAAFAEFLARQERLAGVLRGESVGVVLEGGARVEVTPAEVRPLADLPAVFWVQLVVGAGSFLIGAWVWSLKRGDLPARILAGVGFSTMVFSTAAAVYSTRELALAGGWFRGLSAMNHLGASAFGAGMIALFLVYPRRLVRSGWLWVLPVVFGGWWVADTWRLGLTGPGTGSHLPVMIEMAGILAAAGWQFAAARGDVKARATLRWFALSVALGAGGFVLMVVAPNVFGAEPVLSQGYAFLFFLLVFAGVALGVARYRLFELEGWAFRILFYLGGVFLLVAIDSALIFAAAMDRLPALSVSFMAVAFGYLPLREWLGRRLRERKGFRESLFRRILDVAHSGSAEEQGERWRGLLQGAFEPLRIEAGEAGEAGIVDDGVSLAVPGAGGLGALRLSYAHRGRKLFSLRDAALAEELRALLDYAIGSRAAYEKGVAEERARIARDMHDNIGAQLMSALHSPAAERKDSKIRETLADLRGIINNAGADGRTWEEALAELRYETAERLAAAGVALEWRVGGAGARSGEGGDRPLPAEAAHALRSIVREAVSNALRYAGASRVAVSVERAKGELRLVVEDNGRGLAGEAARGNGLENMRARAETLGGTLEIGGARPGVRVSVGIPLRRSGGATEPPQIKMTG